jgi:hypothetical protein
MCIVTAEKTINTHERDHRERTGDQRHDRDEHQHERQIQQHEPRPSAIELAQSLDRLDFLQLAGRGITLQGAARREHDAVEGGDHGGLREARRRPRDHIGARDAQHRVDRHHDDEAKQQHRQRLDRLVWNHSIVNLQDRQRQRQRKQIDRGRSGDDRPRHPQQMCLVEAKRLQLVPSDAEHGGGRTPAVQDTGRNHQHPTRNTVGPAARRIAPTLSR